MRRWDFADVEPFSGGRTGTVKGMFGNKAAFRVTSYRVSPAFTPKHQETAAADFLKAASICKECAE